MRTQILAVCYAVAVRVGVQGVAPAHAGRLFVLVGGARVLATGDARGVGIGLTAAARTWFLFERIDRADVVTIVNEVQICIDVGHSATANARGHLQFVER